jgi:hypothetical protein
VDSENDAARYLNYRHRALQSGRRRMLAARLTGVVGGATMGSVGESLIAGD